MQAAAMKRKKLVQAKSDLHDGNINFNTKNKK